MCKCYKPISTDTTEVRLGLGIIWCIHSLSLFRKEQYEHSLKLFLLWSVERRKSRKTWNNIIMSKWQDFNFKVNYSFKETELSFSLAHVEETRALEAIWLETHRESSCVVECEAPALAHVWPEARDAAGVQCSVAGAAGLSPEPPSWRWSPPTAAAAAEPPTEQQLDFYTSVRRIVLTCAKPATLIIGYSGWLPRHKLF